MDITNYVKKEAEKIILELESTGYIAGGENGPYEDHETPVRLTAHWICILSWLYKREPDEKYAEAIQKLASFLLAQKVEYSCYSFYCRRKKGKDHVNGTIGQAWVIEGLLEAARFLHDDQYYELAVKVFLQHPFSSSLGVWKRYEVDGKLLGYDETFNHQLWLAAAGGEILEYRENDEIRSQIESFLDHCLDDKLFHIHENGTICHYACISDTFRHKLRFLKLEVQQAGKEKLNKPNLRYKEEGYHYFALYGFAILKTTFGNHPVFQSRKLSRAIDYALNPDNYKRQLCNAPENDGTGLAAKIGAGKLNIYCFAYNSPAFELPYIIKQLSPENDTPDLIDVLWEVQKKATFDDDSNMTKDVLDCKTLTARIYELLRVL